MPIITSTIDFMLRCIEGSLEISHSSCTQIIDFIAESIHVVPKPLQWVGFNTSLGPRESENQPSSIEHRRKNFPSIAISPSKAA